MGSKSTIARSNVITRFGFLEVMPYSDNASLFDVNIFLIILAVSYILLFAAGTVGLYFYLKNKYKNDEFRRMRPKAYVKSAVLGYIGLVLILAAINFIVLRIGFFNSTIPTYNPIDAFVIIFSIAAAISLGLFIKNFASAIKLAKKRREILRLKLDKDVVDDGTK